MVWTWTILDVLFAAAPAGPDPFVQLSPTNAPCRRLTGTSQVCTPPFPLACPIGADALPEFPEIQSMTRGQPLQACRRDANPDLPVDYFRKTTECPPLACFLSHVHSDHLQGLESLRAPFVYCSPATREVWPPLVQVLPELTSTRLVIVAH